MTKKVGKKKQTAGVFKQLALIGLSVAIGYFFAMGYHTPVWNRFINLSAQSFAVNNPVQAPTPKLEFYTLLTQTTETTPTKPVSVSASSSKAAGVTGAAPLSMPAVNAHEGYVVQLASFKRREEAERLQASLIMNGFAAQINVVLQQNMTWYRVVLGPFTSRLEAQHMQSTILHRQRITSIIRKMDA